MSANELLNVQLVLLNVWLNLKVPDLESRDNDLLLPSPSPSFQLLLLLSSLPPLPSFPSPPHTTAPESKAPTVEIRTSRESSQPDDETQKLLIQ